MAPLRRWPFWWTWDVELSTHVERRMSRRDFNELDLRTMMEHAERVRRDHVEGRYVIETRHKRRSWAVIVEPDVERTCVLVITAYALEVE
jgi:hypothetical protein